MCGGCICLLCSINYSLKANEYFIKCWTPSSYLRNLVMSLFSSLSLILPSPLSPSSAWCCFRVDIYVSNVCLLFVNAPWFTSIGAIKRDDVGLVLCYRWSWVTVYGSGVVCARACLCVRTPAAGVLAGDYLISLFCCKASLWMPLLKLLELEGVLKVSSW